MPRFTRAPRLVREVLLHPATPRSIALAVAIGLLVGLLPKSNLLVVGLVTWMFVARTHLLAGLSMALVTTACAGNFDPLLHRVGTSILTWSPVQDVFRRLLELPVVPWTGLNNTVVMGGLVVGGLLFVPTYFLARRLCQTQFAEACG